MGQKSVVQEQVDAVREVIEEYVPQARKKRRGRKLVLLLLLLGVGGLVFSKIRGQQAGPPPVPAAPPARPRPVPAQAAPPVEETAPAEPAAEAAVPSAADALPEEPVMEPFEEPQASVAHAPDVFSDPEVDPLSEGSPVLSDDTASTFFDQVLAETAAEPGRPKKGGSAKDGSAK